MTNRERFQTALADAYRDLFAHDPEYAYAASRGTPDALAQRITEGLAHGRANKDGEGIKRACKVVGIRQTYKAIRPFLLEGETETPETPIRDRVRTKLQSVKMSGRMAALLGAVFQETWTEPRIAELYHTADRMLLARYEGDIGANDFIGSLDDWRRNLAGISTVAGLTETETTWLMTEARL